MCMGVQNFNIHPLLLNTAVKVKAILLNVLTSKGRKVWGSAVTEQANPLPPTVASCMDTELRVGCSTYSLVPRV